MSDNLLNILTNSNKDIDNQKLMDYLNDKLSAEQRHEFEKLLVDSDLESDAVEGLREFKNNKDPMVLAKQLNHHLLQQLQKKKASRQKRRMSDMPWLYFTIIVIILIILIAFLVIREVL